MPKGKRLTVILSPSSLQAGRSSSTTNLDNTEMGRKRGWMGNNIVVVIVETVLTVVYWQ